MNKKAILVLLIVIVAIGMAYGWMEFNRSKATANDMPVKESVTAEELLGAFNSDETAATARFVGKAEQVIQVKGTIRSIETSDEKHTNVILDTGDDLAGVVCEFANTDLDPNWSTGSAVVVNGFCTGMLLDIVLVRCSKAPTK